MARSGFLSVFGICLALLAATPAVGQHLAPHADGALELLRAAVVRDLPFAAPEARGLAVLAADQASLPMARRLAAGLAAEGFTLGDHEEEGMQALVLRHQIDREGGRLEVRDPGGDLEVVVHHGRAEWARGEDPDRLLVTGPMAPDAGRALEGAWRRLRPQAAHWLGVTEDEVDQLRTRDRLHLERTTLAAERDGVTVHQGWMALERTPDHRDSLRHALRAQEAARGRERLVRAALSLGVALLSMGAFVVSDFRTRGYLTGRLRLLFATLCVLGVGLVWRLPL